MYVPVTFLISVSTWFFLQRLLLIIGSDKTGRKEVSYSTFDYSSRSQLS